MSAAHIDVNPAIDASVGRTVPPAVLGAGVALMLLGVVSVGIGFAIAGPAWTWGAILVGLVYTLAIAQGGIIFSVIQTATWGRWGRPFKRVAETLFFVMPIAYVALLVFLVGGLGIYVWNPDTIIPGGPVSLLPHSPEAVASKPIWLAEGFVIARMAIGFLWILIINFVYVRASLAPDLLMARQRLGNRAPGWWGTFIGSETDLNRAIARSQRTQELLAPVIVVSFAAVFTLLAMDLLMSLAPIWYSNMFPAWQTVSGFWLSLAVLTALTLILRDWLGLKQYVRPNHTHDIGKLMLAGCMFWAYTTFAQILPIWYTNMPEETDFLLVRMFLPQWSWLSQLVAITCFVAPFTILLSRGIKKMRWPLVGLCALIMTGIFLERSLMVLPQVHLGDDFPTTWFLLVNVGVWLGCLGLVLTVVSQFLARVPAIVVSDPHLQAHPWDVHVASLDATHHP
ncbi:MAG: hypothetical protein H0V89_09810 [Deltaproteobacteria bacterium]|nr:hypothetical protein [Deltaproteobacteria bacterium]